MSVNGTKQRVLIAGAGVAGIEAALALRDLARERVSVTLHDPRREFSFRPFTVAEPYGATRSFRYDMAQLCELCGARHRPGGIVSVNPADRVAITRDGERVDYDHLLVAGGARMLWSIPGAITFWGSADEGQVADVVERLRDGALERLVFTMAAGRSWTLPLYELALLAATERERRQATQTRIAIVTPEDAPLKVFGRSVAMRVAELLAEREIELVLGAHPIEFRDGRLRTAPTGELEADAVIGLPRLEGRRIAGIPHGNDGFVGVDEHCRVIGLERIYAAGDMTSFPVKQGGIASQQADTAAEAIAAAAGARISPRPFDPILRGVLWTGRGPRYLYGRLAGGHGETSVFSERPEGPLRTGKVTARYFSPLVDSLSASGSNGGPGPAAVAGVS